MILHIEQQVTVMLTFVLHEVHLFSGNQYEYWIKDIPARQAAHENHVYTICDSELLSILLYLAK